jgi:hypothetical protein
MEIAAGAATGTCTDGFLVRTIRGTNRFGFTVGSLITFGGTAEEWMGVAAVLGSRVLKSTGGFDTGRSEANFCFFGGGGLIGASAEGLLETFGQGSAALIVVIL